MNPLREVVDGERSVALVREILRVEGGGPPIAVERTTLPGGPTRRVVLLIHGLAQNRYTWRVSKRSLVARLAEEGFDVRNVELRGHGTSRSWGSGNARSFEEYVEDLVRVIDTCEAPPFAVGHSLGAGVAIGAATRRPLAGLVHLAGLFVFARRNRALRGLAHLTLAAEPVLRLAPVRLSTGWAGDLIGRLYAVSDIAGFGFPIAGWSPGSMERELLAERLALGFDWTSTEVWLEMSRWATGTEFAYTAAFGALDVPLLVLAGDHDRLVPPEDARACFAASGSTDKEIVIFDAYDHRVHWGHVDLILGREAPAVVWPVLVRWLLERSP
ncbi:MAG: alpha/beta fold hydrolase [Deltaproteobacteria bacterium]|nr:alpha/beta fold hydrolase [Deltaproteobacteria bacterium]